MSAPPARRRPWSSWARGVVACAAAALLVGLTGCSDEVSVDAPDLSGSAAEACAAFVDALPDMVADQESHPVDADNAAAWGDPAIVVRCGVDMPDSFNEFSACDEANGVGWYVPDDQVEDQSADVVMTTIGFEPVVDVQVPASHRPPAGIMVEIGAVVKAHLTQVDTCE